ncbi:hypothetical protein FHN55_05215 [Streptomyces sp. NP160]|uniref:hypothetical protein n=1 Tax=Streptomyces sp. NP160 TaxID=2586637 RepID=UPI001119E1C2|nr:hypothetical protein [Streptomyces sp. NP160]TNM69177.1 hypothetical protein FHN55_05215 [Streptomyces sp. NP160]
MSTTSWRRTTTAAAVLTAALVAVPVGAAQADTSQATASPLTVTTAAGANLAVAPVSASSDGTSDDRGPTPSGVLGGQSIVTAGVAVADVRAFATGLSGSCAGLVGSGGGVVVGPGGTCAVSAGSGGVRIALTSTVVLTADAVVSSCTASSTGTSSTKTTIIGGQLTGPLGATAAVSAGTSGSLLGLVSVSTGSTGTQATAGPVSTTALQLGLLSGTAAVRVGAVTCGRNAVVVPTPAVPAAGLPIALAGAAVVAGAARRALRPAPAPHAAGGAS